MAQIRDLSVVKLSDELYLLTACDISAAIGEKKHDTLHVPPKLTGKLTARVALLEVLSSGANIVGVSDVIGAEMEPTGKSVISGILEELTLAELSQIELNGSTEENMETHQTSVGVFITGIAKKEQLKLNNIKQNCSILAIGEPRMGQELLAKPNLEVTYQLVRDLVQSEEVFELVPVGSKGIRYEATQLAQLNGCNFIEDFSCSESWLKRSAGPSTTILLAVKSSAVDSYLENYPASYHIGRLIKE